MTQVWFPDSVKVSHKCDSVKIIQVGTIKTREYYFPN